MIQVSETEYARLVREAAALKCLLRLAAEFDQPGAPASSSPLEVVRRVLERQRGRIRQLEVENHALKSAIGFRALRSAPATV